MLSFFHTDKVHIYRSLLVDNEDGTTGEELQLFQKDVPCRISVLTADEKDESNIDYDSSNTSVKLFLNPNVEIRKSDFLVAERYVLGKYVQTYRGYASDPFMYELSQEVILHDKEKK